MTLLQSISVVLCLGRVSKEQNDYYLKQRQKFLQGFAPLLIIKVIYNHTKVEAQNFRRDLFILRDKPRSWYLCWTLLLAAFPVSMFSPPFLIGS